MDGYPTQTFSYFHPRFLDYLLLFHRLMHFISELQTPITFFICECLNTKYISSHELKT